MRFSSPEIISEQSAPLYPRLRQPLLQKGAALLFALLVGWMYRRYALTFITHSDFAALLLEARDVARGNILLHGWVLTTVSFYTTDVPFMTLGYLIRGFNPVLMSEVPAAMFFIAVGVAMWLSRGAKTTSRVRFFGYATVFALLGLPSPNSAHDLLRAPVHNGGILLSLVALLLIDDSALPLAKTMRVLWIRLTLFTILLAFAAAGDSLTIFIIAAPVALVCTVRLWRREVDDKRLPDNLVLTATIIAVLLSKGIQKGITILGGFHMPDDAFATHFSFVAFDDFPRNVAWTVEGLLHIYGANFFGLALRHSVVPLVRLIPLGLVLYSLYKTVVSWLRKDAPVDRISAILAFAMVVDITAYMFSSLPQRLDTARYLVPCIYLGAVLAARSGLITEKRARKTFVNGLVLAAGLSGAIVVGMALRQPPQDSPERRLGAWLEAHNLRDGYGGYWASLIVTAQSRGHVNVRQIETYGNEGKMHPFLWGCKPEWYRDGKPIYFVVMTGGKEGGVSPQSVSRAFGKPEAVYSVEGYTVLTWDHDISHLLLPPDEGT